MLLAVLPHSRPIGYSLLSLPNELLLEIAEYLFNQITYDADIPAATTFRDANAFLLVNHRLYQLLTPCFLRSAVSNFSWGPPHLCRSILHWAAAHNGSFNLLRKLFAYGGSNLINQVDSRGFSPLLIAVLHNNAAITEFLLKEGANVELHTPIQVTPLLCAVVFRYHDILRLLLDAGADPVTMAYLGYTALHFAFMDDTEDASLVQGALIQARANRSARQPLGYTPAQIEDKLSEAKALGVYPEDLKWGTPLYDRFDSWPKLVGTNRLWTYHMPLYSLWDLLTTEKAQQEFCPPGASRSAEGERANRTANDDTRNAPSTSFRLRQQ